MAQWIFLSEIDKARHLYLDAYKHLHGEASPVIEGKNWNDIAWLESEADRLIIEWAYKSRCHDIDYHQYVTSISEP